MQHALHRVVIIGGGFGGLQAALGLSRAPVAVTLIDRRNFHLFQPLLYQIATGTLSPANIASPLRSLLKRQRNARVLMAEVIGLDAQRKMVLMADGELPYDSLIIAAGARYQYFGHPEWECFAPGLKTIEDATEIRRRIYSAFEEAERTEDPATRAALMTFVVVGGGPTGVELAGALAEIARHTLPREFRTIDTTSARILLIEASPRIMGGFSPESAAAAVAGLQHLGINVRTGASVMAINASGVELRHGEETQWLPTRTVLWAAGVQGAAIGGVIAAATGAICDRGGRIVVDAACSIPGHPECFVLGDLAHVGGIDAPPLPGVAPVAMQQGAYIAKLIHARLDGRTLPPFRYHDRGSMATIGRRLAIADIGRFRLTGTLAWLVWLFIHLMSLVAFENRLMVLLQWAWHYLTWNRNARLITKTGRGGDLS